jgi:hypothetical protein
MEDESMLQKLNAYTRRELSEDEVYLFDVVLCDNDVDRDHEAFSDHALDALQRLFVGKTGVFDHNAKGTNQTSRLFDTQVVLDESKTTQYGTPYRYLKGNAYMVKTSSNVDLIKEIDGGIKKEVSVSCAAKSHRCSICGNDRYDKGCSHVGGKYYGGKLCYTVLDDVTDAYEWSFVAVPAQVRAGVTKRFGTLDVAVPDSLESPLLSAITEDLKRDVVRLGFLRDGSRQILEKHMDGLGIDELLELKKSLLSEPAPVGEAYSQLAVDPSKGSPSLDEYRL